MSSSSSTRLERALELFVAHQQSGGDWRELLARHPDLAELLESFAEGEPAPGPAEGERLDDFRLLREVGRGGVGVVHEARQCSLDRRVALKVLHPAFTGSPTVLARFRREAQTLARLDHAGIVQVFAVGETGGRHWLAMEFVEGQSLATEIDDLRAAGGHRGGSLRRLVEVVAEIAAALQHAHAAGIVHRDVKPSNILLRRDGGAVLGDFGLARDAEVPSLTQTGTVSGTPHYMAPEQILGRAADTDARTDVFALGATLYECLTLQHAFAGANSQQVLQAILSRDPLDPRRLQHGLPADLAAITLKALDREPDGRYPTAQAFADDLRAFLEFRPVAARPPSRTRRLVRLARRQPLVAALAALALVTAMLGGGLLWQWPAVRAAAAARLDGDYEDAMVAGLLARTGKDAEACYRHFRRALDLRPDSREAVAGLCLSLHHFAGPAAALEELERRVPGADLDEATGRCRAVLLHRLQRGDEARALEERLGPPTTPMALWLTALPLLDDAANPAALHQADRLLSLAVRIAPRPRLLLDAQWAVLQTVLDDRVQRQESAEVLVRLWPDHPIALHIAGTNLLKVDPARALDVLRRALELGLDDPLGRVNLGIALALDERTPEALQTLEQAFGQPGLTDAQRARVIEIVAQLGDAALEGRLCEAWLQRDPQNPRALGNLGRHASRQGDDARALDLLRQGLAGAPGDPERRADLAMGLLRAGQPASARDLLLALVQEQPAHEPTHRMLLDVCEDLHDSAGDLVERQRWADAVPQDAAAWRDLAECLLQSPAGAEAERALLAAERADHLDGGRVAANLELRARAHDRLGHGAEAARLRARAAAVANAANAR